MRRCTLALLFWCSLCEVYSLSPPSLIYEFFVLENSSENHIIYDIVFNEEIKTSNNRIINGIQIYYVSPIQRNTIEPGMTEDLFECGRDDNSGTVWKFKNMVTELYIYDEYGFLIMTLDDIDEYIFHDTSGRQIYHTIVITPQIIDAGRIKYNSISPVNPSGYTQTHFEYIEFYDDFFIENLGLSFYINSNAIGFGLNFAELNFFFAKRFYAGVRVFEFNYLSSETFGTSFNFLAAPHIGFNYSFNDDSRIAVNGLIKLGIESVDKEIGFAYFPGFSVNFMYKSVGFKYSGLYSPRYGYINEISVNYLFWFKSFRYKKPG